MPDVLIIARHDPLARAAPRGAARGPGSVPLRGGRRQAHGRRQLARGRPDRRARHRISRCSRSRTSGIDELLKRGLDTLRARPRALPRRLPRSSALEARGHARRLPARPRRPPARERDRAHRRPALLRRAPPRQERARARGHPPRLPRGRGRRRASASSCCAAPRARTARSTLDGEPLTCERIKLEVERAFGEHGAAAEEFIVSHGAQTAVGHDGGSGPIASDDVVLFDLFPRDRESACYSDFTRTFSLGAAVGRARASTTGSRRRRSTSRSRAVKPGVKGSDIHRHGLRLLPRARPQDAAAQGGGRGARRRLLPRDRPRRRPRGARAARASAASRASRSSRAT